MCYKQFAIKTSDCIYAAFMLKFNKLGPAWSSAIFVLRMQTLISLTVFLAECDDVVEDVDGEVEACDDCL